MGPLLRFFALTYATSWAAWLAAAAIQREAASLPAGLQALRVVLYFLGVFAPALVALALTDRADGREKTLALLRRTVQLDAAARWYLFAFLFMAAGIAVGMALLFLYLPETKPEKYGD